MIALVCILFALLSVLALAPPRDGRLRGLVWVGAGVVLVLTAGFRPSDSVPDHIVYEEMYASIVPGNEINYMLEPTFSVIAFAADRIVGHPVFLFVVYALLGVWLRMTAIRQLSDLWFLSLLLYFATFFLQHEMVQMRAGVATGFILMSIRPLYERRSLRFLGMIICATLFHYSALVFLPVWFLSRLGRHDWLLWGIVPLGIAIYLSGADLLGFVFPVQSIMTRIGNALAEHEAGGFDSVAVLGPVHILRLVPYYVMLCFHTRLLRHNRYVTLLLYIYGLGLFLNFAFGRVPVISGRLSDLFVVVEIVLVPMLVYVIRPRPAGRLVVMAIAFCHFLLAVALGERLILW